MEGMQEIVSSSNCLKKGLTFDAELEGPAGRVALDVGGGADVEAGGGPGHPLEDQRAGGAEEDTSLQVLGHPRPLQREIRDELFTWN